MFLRTSEKAQRVCCCEPTSDVDRLLRQNPLLFRVDDATVARVIALLRPNRTLLTGAG